MEIERKFRLGTLPARQILGSGIRVDQGYLLIGEGELRVRRKGDRCYLTVKAEGGLERDEWDTPMPAWAFILLWPQTEGRRIEKTRYAVPHDALTLEVDEYHGHLDGLFTMECEFPDRLVAERFVIPEWASGAYEVTDDPAYKNKALAVHGLPNTPKRNEKRDSQSGGWF